MDNKVVSTLQSVGVFILNLIILLVVLHVLFCTLLVGMALRYHKQCGQLKIISASFIALMAYWGGYYVSDVCAFFSSKPLEVSGTIQDVKLTSYPNHLITNHNQKSTENVLAVTIKTPDDKELTLYETRVEFVFHSDEELLEEQANYLFSYYPKSKVISNFKKQ